MKPYLMLQFWRTEVYLLIKNPSAVNERVHSFNNFGTSIKSMENVTLSWKVLGYSFTF